MKKLLIALVLGLALVGALATIAAADNGPHGNFVANEDACAGCHRMHTAIGADFLFVASSEYALCMSCHDGTGAYTNARDGYYTMSAWNATDHGTAPGVQQGDLGYGLFGGGFETVIQRTVHTGLNYFDTGSTLPAAQATTSTHGVVGAPGYTTPTMVWGAGDINTGNGVDWTTRDSDTTTAGVQPTELTCSSCHEPHGNGGRTVTAGVIGNPVASYRLLRFDPHGSDGFEVTSGSAQTYTSWTIANGSVTAAADAAGEGGVLVADIATKWYTPNSNYTADPSLEAFRARNVGDYYSSYIQGAGDTAGRVYVYRRPAFFGNAAGGEFVCMDNATNLPDKNDLACFSGGAAGSTWDNTAALTRMSYWCTTCHDRYFAASGARSTPSGDSTFMYRHTNASTSFGGCASCHAAHGTAAPLPTGYAATGGLAQNSSVLLKYSNRSICLDCHATSVNFWTSNLVIR